MLTKNIVIEAQTRQLNSPKNSEEIRARLRPYEKHTSTMCLNCGYDGLMGVMSTVSPLGMQFIWQHPFVRLTTFI